MRLKCHTEIISNISPRFLQEFTIDACLLKLVTSTYMRLKCHTEIISKRSPRFLQKFTIHASLLKLV